MRLSLFSEMLNREKDFPREIKSKAEGG